MMKKNPFFLLLLTVAFAQLSNAQPICGFDALHGKKLESDPAYRKSVIENEARIQTIIKEQQSRKAGQPLTLRTAGTLATLYTIPVVVHVVHTGGTVGTIYNPSDAQITGAIDYLNQVYAGTYPGTEGVGEIQIQFALATRDENCNPTTGIDRVNGSSITGYTANGVNVNTSSGASELDVKNASRWNPSSFYNIWVVNKIDGADGTSGQFIAGFAYFPGASPSLDGTVMLATQMESGAKTLPHEIGHALNLYHPFQGSSDASSCPANTDCSAEGDRVCDTDPITYNQTGGTVDFTCRTGTNTCTGTSYSTNTESNYMNYTNCYTLFTQGQKDRMLAAMDLPERASYINSWGLAATYPVSPFGAPAATCDAASTTAHSGLGLLGITVNARTFSSGTSGEDGGYLDKTGECSSLIYLQAGETYTLTATLAGINYEQVAAWLDYNNDGAFSASEQILATQEDIAPSSGVYPYPQASQSFTIPSDATTETVLRLRVVEDADNRYGTALINSGCMNPDFGQVEDYPVYIAASVLPITMEYFKGDMIANTIRLSWKTAAENGDDVFELERSYNGTDYTTIGTMAAKGISTGAVYSYDDKSFTGPVIYYRLKLVEKNGRYKYSEIVTFKNENVQERMVIIHNNPFKEKFNISITTEAHSKVVINMMDVTGKLIYTKTISAGNGSTFTVEPDTRKLSPGIYLVQVNINGKTITKKVIKE